MKHSYIIQAGHPRLLAFFAGWASDPTPFQNYRPTDRDYVICYDYRTLESDFIQPDVYREVDIVAWSMGVWAASHIVPRLRIAIGRNIAINGTPHPIDAAWGIPPAIWQGTLEHLSPLSLHKFTRRMCADTEAFHRFLRVTPHRPVEELAEEMRAITHLHDVLPAPTFAWQQAIVGSNDRIIPPDNQTRAWQELNTPVTTTEIAHYDEPTFKLYLQDLWTNNK